MKSNFSTFVLHTLIIGLLLTLAATLLFLFLIARFYHPLMPFILIAAMTINVISFRLLLRDKNRSSNLMMSISKTFALKFFSYILLAILLILIEKGKTGRIMLILTEFLLYIVFTWHEVNAFIRLEKKKNN